MPTSVGRLLPATSADQPHLPTTPLPSPLRRHVPTLPPASHAMPLPQPHCGSHTHHPTCQPHHSRLPHHCRLQHQRAADLHRSLRLHLPRPSLTPLAPPLLPDPPQCASGKLQRSTASGGPAGGGLPYPSHLGPPNPAHPSPAHPVPPAPFPASAVIVAVLL